MTLRIHLSILQPPGYVHSLGFLDQARYARHQFRRFGAKVTIGKNRLREDAVNIILGAHLGFPANLKQRYTCVFFNLEQLGEGGAQVGDAYMDLLRTSAVIDYDSRNLASYGCKGGDVPVVTFHHAPYLSDANPVMPLQDRPIDLLFFGSVNERRKAMFDRIEACGVSVSRFDHPLYGDERDEYIRQSKAVFNCHFYETSRFEQARAFHTLSLGTPLISERTARTTPPPAFEDAVSWVCDDDLEAFFSSEFMTPAWQERAHRQLKSFAEKDPAAQWQLAFLYCESLWASEHAEKSGRLWLPSVLHVGAGSHHRLGWLNVGSMEGDQPDLVLDLGRKLNLPFAGQSPYGGHILMGEDSLDKAYVSGGLEQFDDPQALMHNLLILLREGGELVVDVPLQPGPVACQADHDSWAVVAEDHVRFGQLSHRFELVSANAVDAAGRHNPQGPATALRVVLCKRATTPHERMVFRSQHVTFGEVGEDETSRAPAESRSPSPRHSPLQPQELALELVEDAAQIDHLITAGQYEQALTHIVGCVNATFLQPGVVHHALYYPRLDVHLSRMAEILSSQQAPMPSRMMKENHLIIATELYRVGGHSKVVEEVARELPNAVIVLTDIFRNRARNPAAFDWIESTYSMAQVVDLPRASLWQSAQNLASFAHQLQPSSIWYFNHHQDPIPFIGTLGIEGPSKLLLHHCDHNPSLGATLRDVVHVDITDSLQQACSDRLGAPTELLRLYVADQGLKFFSTVAGTDYSVVTAGRPGKFARNGELALSKIIATTLSTVRGMHYHIGPLDAEWQQEIKTTLSQRGLSSERFISLGAVPSLWSTLLEIDAAVYIGSAPVSGGRGAVEAQGCGLPVLPFTGFEPGSLLADFSSYADVGLGWSDLLSLTDQLRSLGNRHTQLSRAAREFYEAQFSHDGFRRQVKRLSATNGYRAVNSPLGESPCYNRNCTT
jgi:hypothetical protein